MDATTIAARVRAESWVRMSERALERILEPHSDNTRKAYRQAWRQWREFCAERGAESLPVHPELMVTYFEDHRKDLRPNSVRQHLSALQALDDAARLTATGAESRPLLSHPRVKRWMQSWNREHPRAPEREAPALTVRQLEQLLREAQLAGRRSVLPAAHVALYARDRALILMGVVGAFRVSELCALELRDVEVTERGLRVRVRRSKGDQEGKGAQVGLMPQEAPFLCPCDAWLAWLAVRGTLPGAVFQAIGRRGELSGRAMAVRSVHKRVCELGAAVGLELVSAHSLRATFATLAAERGKSPLAIAEHGRWKSLETVRRYIRQGSLFRDNPGAGLLEDG